jgi:hypothetical protein
MIARITYKNGKTREIPNVSRAFTRFENGNIFEIEIPLQEEDYSVRGSRGFDYGEHVFVSNNKEFCVKARAMHLLSISAD